MATPGVVSPVSLQVRVASPCNLGREPPHSCREAGWPVGRGTWTAEGKHQQIGISTAHWLDLVVRVLLIGKLFFL